MFDNWEGFQPPPVGSGGIPSDIAVRGAPDRGALRRGAGMRVPPPAGPAGQLPRPASVQIPPPELVVYPEAQNLAQSGTATGLATGATSVLASFQLGQGQVAVVNTLVISAVNLTTAQDIAYALRVAGSPVPGFAPRRIPPQNSAFGVIGWGPQEMLVWVPEGALIELVATVLAGGPADPSGQFSGWEYPRTLREQYRPAWS